MEPRRIDAWQRFLRSFWKHKVGVVGLVIILGFALIAILGPVVAPHDPYTMSLRDRFVRFSPDHLLGTDLQGRDLLSRIIYGARPTLLIGLGSVALAFVIGATIGITGGYFRRFEPYIMRVIDVWLAFPTMVIALVVVAITGPGLGKVIVAVALGQVPQFARLTFSLALTLRDEEFVEAARSVGATDARLIFRHVLPNCVAPIVVQATLFIPGAILSGAGLSFLGLGVQAPTPEWGLLLGVARSYVRDAPHLMIYPGLAMMFVVFGFNIFGDALRDTLDPKTRR